MMKKYFHFLLIAAFGILIQSNTPSPKKGVKVTATLSNCSGTLGIYKFDGVGFLLIEETKAAAKDQYIFHLPKGETTIYYIGKNDAQKLPVIVGPEAEIELKSDCLKIRNATFVKSDLNNQYNLVVKKIQEQKAKRMQLMRQLQKAKGFPDMIKKSEEAIAKHELEKSNYIDSMMIVNPFLGKMAAINGYKSFPANKMDYKNELDHFGKEFFANTPLEDPAYDELTFLFEAYREFASTLAKLNLKGDILNPYLEHSLQRIKPNRPAYKNALGGIVLALQAANHPSYLEYGHRFYAKYKDEKRPHIQGLAESLENAKSLLEGGQAPNLTGNNPEGESLQLSDLKGQYVLIDFWASWCGPCRRENPHVVKLYEKYHEKGFEIFGVSLDREKNRWVKAIKDDGLTWQHISDLKGWQSGHAATYGVRSVPTTVLLDKEGKIIARNLRAPELDLELQKIFKE